MATKALNPTLPQTRPVEAMRGSVREFDATSGVPRISILQIASVADEAPAWPSLRRDKYLDLFWPKESSPLQPVTPLTDGS